MVKAPLENLLLTSSLILNSRPMNLSGILRFMSRNLWLSVFASMKKGSPSIVASDLPYPVMLFIKCRVSFHGSLKDRLSSIPVPGPGLKSRLHGGGEFFPVEGSGADLAYDDARREVGQHSRLLEARPGRDGEGEDRYDGVSGAAHVKDLLRDRRDVRDRGRLKEAHAVLPPRYEEGLGAELVKEEFSGPVEARIVLYLDAGGLGGLEVVGCDDRNPLVVVEVLDLRVNRHGFMKPPAEPVRLLDEEVRDEPFRVVGDDYDVRGPDGLLYVGEELLHLPPVVVVADDPGDERAPAEAVDVVYDVGASAKEQVLLADLHYGD